MTERDEILKDIEKLTPIIWKKKSEYQARFWIKGHIGKPKEHCNMEELRIVRYLMVFKAKTGRCPIVEHHQDSDYRRRKVVGSPNSWKMKRQELEVIQEGRCAICKRLEAECPIMYVSTLSGGLERVTRLDIDHIVPIFLGGLSNIENLRLLCKTCHDEKSKRETWHAIKIFKRDKLQVNIALAKKYYYEYKENQKYERTGIQGDSGEGIQTWTPKETNSNNGAELAQNES